MFCTDDKHPYDIEVVGHINYNVNLAIKNGLNPIDVIKIATINAATCYRLFKKGAIAPGFDADLIVFNVLNDIQPTKVIINGSIVYEENKLTFEAIDKPNQSVLNTVHVAKTNIDFDLPLHSNKANVIGLIDDNVTTKHLIEEVVTKDGLYVNNSEDDILKIAVIERHTGSNRVQVGLIKGYGLRNGAIGMTIAHDSHNIIIVGDNDQSMKLVLDDLVKMNGGIAIAKGDRLKSHLTLEIGGLMTNKSHDCVSKRLLAMEEDARKMGVHKSISDPFLSLAFMSLSVIPELKITDKGLFDVINQKHIPVGVDNL
jgi:adenine deaminase